MSSSAVRRALSTAAATAKVASDEEEAPRFHQACSNEAVLSEDGSGGWPSQDSSNDAAWQIGMFSANHLGYCYHLVV
jgi:hypothetical protein